MIEISNAAAVTAGAVLALLTALGGFTLFAGLRARARASALLDAHRRADALAEIGPAQAMIVRADGRIELSDKLADLFGLEAIPSHLSEIVGNEAVFEASEAAALERDIAAAQKAARPFRATVRARGSSRTLLMIGQRAPDAVRAPGGVVLWVFDATEAQEEVARLSTEAARYREAFEALTGLIQSAPMPMWYRDRELKLAMVNNAYVSAVNGKDAEAVVRAGIELVDASAPGGPLASAGAARDARRAKMVKLPATIGGARRMLHIHDVPLPTGGVAGFAVDVEELERARAGIKLADEAQREMFDRMSSGVAQFGADRSLVFCNQPFRRMFAMRSEWLADGPEFERVLERMREANRLPVVRDFPGWKAERRDWFVAADAAREENWTLPGGTHLRVVAQPLPEGGLLLLFEDLTEQVQLASARDTLLRVRTATFDNLFEALGVFAADGRLQLWNNRFRQLWGFEEAFITSHPRVDALAKEAGARLASPGRAVLIAELVRAATVERQQRGAMIEFNDGRYFEAAAVPLPDGNALFTMLDISDRRRVENALRERNEALEAADRVKTAFVANMSYELRTPLTSIQGFAEMLHGGYAGELSQSGIEYSEAILDSVARLGALIDDVLDLTREDGAPARGAVDLELAAGAAAEAVAPAAQAKRIELAVEILGSAGAVQGDARRIRQTIEHLLRHAVAGTPEAGRVLLHIDGTAEGARIVVSDNGPGMAKKFADKAFERFAQPGISRGGDRALGLGLPLAKQFVEAHGGTIELVSEPGQGTMVTVELPRG
ncbi:PAS-domain containing protein [Sphingomonas sp. BT-65]|uniref:PAS domain-containing sensor histidine kinase n=1 Tax=Sphingomonas sp. BT-65 TaxID=2989821 RepID=UPI002236653C|nr:PAS domain-containing sensor histidine kinase [Sphingomonas sp. BT-65]MCW4460177.1 PAS-domain containing protein [Sphingomonas sp. BT-65]